MKFATISSILSLMALVQAENVYRRNPTSHLSKKDVNPSCALPNLNLGDQDIQSTVNMGLGILSAPGNMLSQLTSSIKIDSALGGTPITDYTISPNPIPDLTLHLSIGGVSARVDNPDANTIAATFDATDSTLVTLSGTLSDISVR